MTTESLLRRLEAAQPTIARRDMYYRGDQGLRFMADKVDPKMVGFTSNLARVAVTAVAERIRVEDVTASVDGRDVSEMARTLVRDSDLPMTLQSTIVDMLAVGSAYLIVWADEFGRPVVTGESAEQVAVERHPVTRAVTAAVKRWEITDANGVVVEEHVVKYLPNEVVHLTRDAHGGKLTFRSSTPNPLGVVPVVPLVNLERIHDDVGTSVVDDLAPLLDALNKLVVDMLVTSEAVARPKRYATGVTLEEDLDGFAADEEGFTADGAAGDQADEDGGVQAPFRDADDMWISEEAEAKFGQLPGAEMSGYSTAVDLIMQQIMAVTSLPAHLVGITSSNPSTAEALRASEVALASNAGSRIRVVNRPLEWAVRLLVAIAEGVAPSRVSVRLRFADPSTRSVAQDADAAVKLHAENIINDEQAAQSVSAGEEL
ncbi:phage portal protein [Corynebacterium variabile]|uniref:phage portal protein n=1 Tax=Corynebacterium variabile TaxID=1727 RepID=UPI003FD32AB1